MAKDYRELNVYKNGFRMAMDIFQLSKHFPLEERYSLTSQIRKSSRSVCANLAESWRRRRYKAAFIAKLNDSESEASETQFWIEMAKECGYLTEETAYRLAEKYDHILSQLVCIIEDPDKWIVH